MLYQYVCEMWSLHLFNQTGHDRSSQPLSNIKAFLANMLVEKFIFKKAHKLLNRQTSKFFSSTSTTKSGTYVTKVLVTLNKD